jgi:hypothetical protein
MFEYMKLHKEPTFPKLRDAISINEHAKSPFQQLFLLSGPYFLESCPSVPPIFLDTLTSLDSRSRNAKCWIELAGHYCCVNDAPTLFSDPGTSYWM